jgi:hypothetical protein
MTSSTTSTTAADDGGTTSGKEEHPVAVLRREEGRALIGMVCEAIHATSDLTHRLHQALYGPQGVIPVTDLKQVMSNAQACLEVASRHLCHLDEVLDSAVPPDWEPIVVEPATHW